MSGDIPPRPEPAAGESRVCVARIAGTYGVRGEVRLLVFTEDPDALRTLGPFEDQAGTRTFSLTSLRPHGEGFVARLAEIASCDDAEAHRNTDLFVPRARLPAIDDEETFYHADLIGLEARTPSGDIVGKVVAVQNFGAGDILDIAPTGSKTSQMVPFTKAMVPSVDLGAGYLTLASADVVVPPAPRRSRSPRP